MEWFYQNLQEWINNGCDKDIANQVSSLNIVSENLNSIPIEVFSLTQLQIFYCSYNQIKYIPKEIENLTQLRLFCCDVNQIDEIPKEIKKLIQLRRL